MSNALSKQFNFLSLMKFTMPTIIMMVFMSLYTMVDGVFVSRFVGTNALSAINIAYPMLNVIIAISIMLATGGSAIIGKKMGEGKKDEVNQNFSLIITVGIIIGFIILILGSIFIDSIVRILGANDAIFEYCKDYARVLLLFTPFAILQMLFQYFFVVAGKPIIGLTVTIIGGVFNIILDYIFIVPLKMGISGAALATGIGFCIPAIAGLIYFSVSKQRSLYFSKFKFEKKVLWDSCTNGSSEMVTNLSIAVTTFLFNMVMMTYLGEDGVAAITIVLYAQYTLTAIYLGYSSGISPIISFNHGNKNTGQLKKLFKISMIFLSIVSVVTYITSLFLCDGIVRIFTEAGSSVYNIAKNGFYFFAFCYLFMGVNIFISALFTALSNGKVSAIISFMRTFVFIISAILILPKLFGVNGIWLAVPIAEVLSLAVSFYFVYRYKKEYGYFD